MLPGACPDASSTAPRNRNIPRTRLAAALHRRWQAPRSSDDSSIIRRSYHAISVCQGLVGLSLTTVSSSQSCSGEPHGGRGTVYHPNIRVILPTEEGLRSVWIADL